MNKQEKTNKRELKAYKWAAYSGYFLVVMLGLSTIFSLFQLEIGDSINEKLSVSIAYGVIVFILVKTYYLSKKLKTLKERSRKYNIYAWILITFGAFYLIQIIVAFIQGFMGI